MADNTIIESDPDQLVFSIAAARQSLGVSHQTVYDLINSGALRTFRVGRRRFISRQALLDFISAREADEITR